MAIAASAKQVAVQKVEEEEQDAAQSNTNSNDRPNEKIMSKM